MLNSENIKNIAFIGLGTMGYPMASHLSQSGYRIKVFNRTHKKAEAWVIENQGETTMSPGEAARGADMIFSCVGNDDDVREICMGQNGAFSSMKEDSIFVDHTTASSRLAKELDIICKKNNCHFLDAPVSGGQSGAENGTLSIMVGGSQEVFSRAEPIMRSYSRTVQLMGPVGSGQLTKMVNQICIAGLLQGLAEGLEFGKRCGLNIDDVLNVISKGAAQSWQMDNRGSTMNQDQFDFGFAVDWMRKDLKLCLEEASLNGARIPVTALVDQFYGTLQEQGQGRSDTSSLIKLLRD